MDGERYEVRNNAELEVDMIISLYDKNENNFNHNGKRILKPIKAAITEELNGDYSLEITMPRGEELIEQQKELLSDKERRLTELTNETAYKQQQIMDAELIGNINEATMTLDDKIDIVKKVIKKVNVVRLSKYTAHITIFNRINDIVTVYELKSNIRSKDRGWRKKEEYHLKEKKTS